MRLFRSLAGLALSSALAAGCATPSPTPAQLAPTATTVRPAPTAPAAAQPVETATAHPSAPTALPAAGLGITWLGQSTFVLTAGTGFKALLDPAGPGTGYAPARVEGVDVVTISHEHSDHNSTALAAGNPLLLRGLLGSDWSKVDLTVKGVRIRSVGTFHDDSQGSQRGKNSVFVFEAEGLRVAHLGDLGHTLTATQVADIGPVDIILIPVGGFYTIDAAQALEVADQLKARVVAPMHFRTAAVGASLADRLAPADTFTTAAASRGWRVSSANSLSVSKSSLPVERTIAVLSYQ